MIYHIVSPCNNYYNFCFIIIFCCFISFYFLFFTLLFFVYLNAVLGEFFPTKPEFWRNLLFDLLLFLMVEKALVFVCIDI